MLTIKHLISNKELNMPARRGHIGNLILNFLVVTSLMMTILITGSVKADFTVAFKSVGETMPSVAHNAKTGDLLVAFLEEYTDLDGTRNIVSLKRFNSQGQPLSIGGVDTYHPFGTPIKAIGRPAIAYSSNSNMFLIAFPQRVETNYGDYDRIFARPLGPDGQSACCLEFLFDDENPTYPHQDDNYYVFQPGLQFSALNITHNSILNEFLITAQFTHWKIYGTTPMIEKHVLLGQRFSVASNSTIGSPITLTYNIPLFGGGFENHAVDYAPVKGTEPYGGRYVLTTWGPQLYDAHGKFITDVPLNYGRPENSQYVNELDVACGNVKGEQRCLVVYSDRDNCSPGFAPPCTGTVNEWTGVWGAYINPKTTSYGSSAKNTPFPISDIPGHYSTTYGRQPRVAYNANAKTFFVVWWENPSDIAENNGQLSHIRGSWVDYFVEDGLYPYERSSKFGGKIPGPRKNIVISDVTGTCTSTNYCTSDENPRLPDVCAVGNASAVAVWQQKYVPNPSDLDIKGDIFTAQ
jgi:hypothetical protein